MNLNICNNCGGDYINRNGRWICQACGAYKPEEISNEEITLLYTASQALRLADFDVAEREFDDIIQKYPQNANGYWGRLMAKYGIKYEDDFDGRKIPTCYATSIESVSSDPDYQKALKFADPETKDYYKRQVEYIERVRKEWVEKARKEKPYDIFICYKDSDLANGIDRTEDSIAAQDLYIHLTTKGYRVFYSHESLRDKVGEKYEPYIFHALSTAKVMLVYGSKPEYITSTWLKNEWTRYEKRIKLGEKHSESLLVACDGFSPAELPKMLSSRQCFDATRRSFYGDLDATVDRIIKQKKKAVPPPVSARTKKKSRAPLIVTLTFCIVAAASVGGYALLGKKDPNTPPPDESKISASTQENGAEDTSKTPGGSDTNANTPSGGDTENPGGPIDSSPIGSDVEITEPAETDAPTPSFNFDGAEISVISRGSVGDFVSEFDGNQLSTAIYERDRMAEELLNVKFKYHFDNEADPSSIINTLQTYYNAGEAGYDIVATSADTTANASLNGIFCNLRNLPNLNLNQSWWNQNYNNTMAYKNAQFSATGDMFLLGEYAFATVYNRELFERAYQGVDMIATAVQNGNWTLAGQFSMAFTLYQNHNNFTSMTAPENAIYGLVSATSINTDALWTSCGISVIDPSDFTLASPDERFLETVDLLLVNFTNRDGSLHHLTPKENYAEQEDIITLFTEKRAGMATLRLMDIRKIRNNSFINIGIAPMPTMHESQETYPTPIDSRFSVVTVPKNVANNRQEMVGAVLETLGKAGQEVLQPAYRDNFMMMASNEDDTRMLEIINENITFEAGLIYADSMGRYTDCLRSFIQNNTHNVATYFATQKNILNMRIDSIREKLDNLAS